MQKLIHTIKNLITLIMAYFKMPDPFKRNTIDTTPVIPDTTVPDESDTQPSPDTQLPSDKTINALLEAHNQQRQKVGAKALKLNTILCEAALNHARWMHNNSTMSHRGENNSSVSSRVSAAGYNAHIVGENIAYGYRDVSSVMNVWLRSYGHKTNIRRKQYKEVGIGKSGNYWCVVFAAPMNSGAIAPQIATQEFIPE